MADPLSITASIIAVLGAAEGLTKTLAKIRNIRNAPEELLALINEISDLRIVIGDVQYYVQNAPKLLILQEPLQHMSILITRAKVKLLQTDELVQYRLMKPGSVVDQIKVSRREWARSRVIIDSTQYNLRDIRLNIVAQLLVINSSHQSRLGLTIDDIYIISKEMQSIQSQAENRTAQQLNEHSNLLSDVLSSQSSLHTLLNTGRRPEELGPDLATNETPFMMDCSSNQVLHIGASLRQRSPCTEYYKVIGSLFVGYSGYSSRVEAFTRCTRSDCLSQTTVRMRVCYLFPSWFLARALIFGLTSQALGQIGVSLEIQRIIPFGSDLFRRVKLDDIDGIKQLFRKGLASPNDIQMSGENALHEAVHSRSFTTAKFLLQAGADPWHMNFQSKQTSYDHAWNIIFLATDDPTTGERLRSLFPSNNNYIEEHQFSIFHKIVLGLSYYDLEEKLAVFGDAIDSLDREGKTPLLWASCRGDTTTVRQLLKAKADPNIVSTGKIAALFGASRLRNIACVRTLLDAGANPAHIDSDRYNALHYVANSYTPENLTCRELVKILKEAGVNVNGRNINGGSPLFSAAHGDAVMSATALLDYGADIEHLDNDGDSPLHQALFYQSDEVTKLLLSRGANHTLRGSLGSILHFAATSGTLRTLEILQNRRLNGIDPDASNRQGKSALDLAQERQTKPEGFVQKFQELLTDVRINNAICERHSHSDNPLQTDTTSHQHSRQ